MANSTSQTAEALRSGVLYRTRLPSKSNAELAWSVYQTIATSDAPFPPRLIVFLNNLLMPACSWRTLVTLLGEQHDHVPAMPSRAIPMLIYDRFGQGETVDRDPRDSRPEIEPGYGHDFADVVADLRELIAIISPRLFPKYDPVPKAEDIELLLVGASIGAPLARLYASTYPATVAGIILLDSNIANANYSSFWPNPSDPDLNPDEVTAPDCTLEQYKEAASKLAATFDLNVKNGESLDRRNTPQLLPYPDRPRLWARGPGRVLTKIMVVGHDPEAFAEEGFEKMGTPRSFTKRWMQTAWDRYNQGLLQIGDSEPFGGVRIAKGCGHFIQRDDPEYVARALVDMLTELKW